MRLSDRGIALLAAAVAILACGGGGAAAQTTPQTAPDPIEASREISRQTFPAPPPQQPSEVWVPERRVPVPGADKEVVVPGHWERRASDQRSVVPPLSGYESRGGKIIHIPGGERPPAPIRRGP
jgi:hypothetical protein